MKPTEKEMRAFYAMLADLPRQSAAKLTADAERHERDRKEAALAEIDRIEDLCRAWNDKGPTSQQESDHYKEMLRNWND